MNYSIGFLEETLSNMDQFRDNPFSESYNLVVGLLHFLMDFG